MKNPQTQKKQIHGIDVFFKFRSALQDRKHLLVIFSGFRKFGTYDFDGTAVNGIRANILWIQDNFDENFAYYLQTSFNDRISNSVHRLIEETREDLGLNSSDVTVAGFSKGGTAALYYGIKYNYGAIISTVPQFRIGSYVKESWPKVHAHMTKQQSAAETDRLDQILSELIDKDQYTKRNIYLFSSTGDEQYETEIEPNLNRFDKYSNFNLILTDSPIVDKHHIVTRYNVPLILSIMGALSDGAIPRFGTVLNGSGHRKDKNIEASLKLLRDKNEVVANITKLNVTKDRIFPEGYVFIKGYEASSHAHISANIILKSTTENVPIPLGTTVNNNLNYDYFDSVYCDYRFAGIASLGHSGINIDKVPYGKFIVFLRFNQAGRETTTAATSTRLVETWHAYKGDVLRIKADTTSVEITRRPSMGIETTSAYFEMTEFDLRNKTLYLQGYLIQPGFNTINFGDVIYYLVLSATSNHNAVYTVEIASAHRADANTKIDHPWGDYSKSYFATLKYLGINLSHILSGTYNVYVTARYGEVLFTTDTGQQLTFD